MRGLSAGTVDELMAEAVEVAAHRLAERNTADDRVLEASLDQELIAALSSRWSFGAVREEGHTRGFELVGWERFPGGPDVSLYEDESRVAIAEDKWSTDGDNLYELMHDVFKITALHASDDFVAGYLVAGAPMRLWDKPTTCADWFGDEANSTKTLASGEFLATHASDWAYIQKRSSGLVRMVPSEVELRTIVVVPITIREKVGEPGPWSVRCLRATPKSSAAMVELSLDA